MQCTPLSLLSARHSILLGLLQSIPKLHLCIEMKYIQVDHWLIVVCPPGSCRASTCDIRVAINSDVHRRQSLIEPSVSGTTIITHPLLCLMSWSKNVAYVARNQVEICACVLFSEIYQVRRGHASQTQVMSHLYSSDAPGFQASFDPVAPTTGAEAGATRMLLLLSHSFCVLI